MPHVSFGAVKLPYGACVARGEPKAVPEAVSAQELEARLGIPVWFLSTGFPDGILYVPAGAWKKSIMIINFAAQFLIYLFKGKQVNRELIK